MDDLQRAKEYSRKTERLALVSTAAGVALSVGFVLTGEAGRVSRFIIPGKRATSKQRIAYVLTLAAGSWFVALPLSFYRSYIVEHEYGLSNQTPAKWALDAIKQETIGLAIALPLIEALYRVIGRSPRYWWLVAAGATIPLSAVLAQLAPVLILPRFFRFEPLEDEALATRLKGIAARSGVQVADVYQVDLSRRTTKANAFFTGLGATKRIALGDTLIDQMSADEIEVVIAHELGHQVNRDVWRFIVLSAVYTLVTAGIVHLSANRLLKKSENRIGTQRLDDIRSLPLLGLVFSLTGLVLGPLQLAYMRHVERQADDFALQLTENPNAFVSSMTKLALSNLSDPDPSRVMVALLYSHPPMSERVARAREWGSATACSP